ncbi:hypothetical protein VE04_05776 [Pseudogymnoascus sp. 24MN13]|nr:hypothetical protein VE04_05776 [Pseudogymnoascus sp. 24MN13]
MEDTESFTLLPVHLDPKSKALSTTSNSKRLRDELESLNALHTAFLSLETPAPLPPRPPSTQSAARRSPSSARVPMPHTALRTTRPRYSCAYGAAQLAAGWKDAEASVEAKKVGNAKAWWRGGRCLAEMSRWEEAKEWVGRGLEVEGKEAELVGLLKEIEGRVVGTVKP